ncbi:MAG: tetratricopeptide repeat protein [Chloroflexi bacterium]|nr:tetratricopeptide repeat protein [Chloroflexota bacterium]
MAKRKRKSRRGRRAQSSSALRQNGLRAFKRGEYEQAIEIWQRAIRQTPNEQTVSALAEAYFRRGLNHLYGQSPKPQAGLSDLKQASKLQSSDPRYAYHLGLGTHRQGDLDGAVRIYRTAYQGEGEFADRVAYPLALALLQRGDDPTADPVWSTLSIEEQTMLSQARAFHRRPYTLSSDAPLLWRGLVALDAGEREQAQTAFDGVLESVTNPAEQRIAHYYLGVLAAQGEDWDKARHQWSTAHASGLMPPHLKVNLGEVYHRLAEERMTNEDVESALAAATEALRHKPDDKQLGKILSQIHQHIAYQAASADQWEAAHDHWETANAMEGGSFRLAYNMALAYERAEDFFSAGETWRQVLRRRPRRADHPDAINDEQVAQLWKRSAEAYRKAGEYDEAIHVYRQAVKWNPEHAETRMALSEALLANGQMRAAENELDRILERDPDNIPALLRQGEVAAASGRWWRWNPPTSYWERVLELEPENGDARQLLADFYQNRAEIDISWSHYSRAVEMYQKALEYMPKNAKILAALGGCYLRMDDESTAQSYIEKALIDAPSDLDVYDEIIHAWFDMGEPNQAWDVLEKAEATIDAIPYQFYLSQASYCMADYQSKVVRSWLERAVEKALPDVPIFLIIGEMTALEDHREIGCEYLEQAIALGQEPGHAHLLLGVIAIQENDRKMANKHWGEAEKIARRTRDAELEERIQMTRLFFSGPPGLMNLLMELEARGAPLPDFFDDEYDDDNFFDI